MKPTAPALVLAALVAALPLLAFPARADEKADIAELTKVMEWARPVTGSFCDFPDFAPEGDILGSNRIHRFQYRYSYETTADPAHDATLYELHCMNGAYNWVNIYVMKNAFGDLQVLSFAEPVTSVDYEDPDTMTKIKGKPKVTGWRTMNSLVNAEFDPATLTITSFSKWRGLGDAWSSGRWSFADDEFVLKEYSVDPVYNLNAPDADPESAVDNPADAFKIWP